MESWRSWRTEKGVGRDWVHSCGKKPVRILDMNKIRSYCIRHSWNSRSGLRLHCCTFYEQFHVLLTAVLPGMSSCFIGVLYIMETHKVTVFRTYKLCSVWDMYRFLVNETNRCTEFQFYWYYYSTCFGQSFWPSSGVLGRTSTLVHFIQLWWTVCYQE